MTNPSILPSVQRQGTLSGNSIDASTGQATCLPSWASQCKHPGSLDRITSQRSTSSPLDIIACHQTSKDGRATQFAHTERLQTAEGYRELPNLGLTHRPTHCQGHCPIYLESRRCDARVSGSRGSGEGGGVAELAPIEGIQRVHRESQRGGVKQYIQLRAQQNKGDNTRRVYTTDTGEHTERICCWHRTIPFCGHLLRCDINASKTRRALWSVAYVDREQRYAVNHMSNATPASLAPDSSWVPSPLTTPYTQQQKRYTQQQKRGLPVSGLPAWLQVSWWWACEVLRTCLLGPHLSISSLA